jgi:hypothetical protein
LSREFGDFQTPPELVKQVLRCLLKLNRNWTRVLEPTCGSGAFIKGLLQMDEPPSEIIGIEIQDKHLTEARKLPECANGSNISIKQADFFRLEVSRELHWTNSGPLLVLGNPPWVTNSELSILASSNRPAKRNLKKLRGIEAMTGDSNFDVAEYIWIKLLKELAAEKPAIALLCKTMVARNVLKYAAKHQYPITNALIRCIDAKKWFGASVDACLFYVELGQAPTISEVPVFADLTSDYPESVIGLVKNQLVSNWEDYQRFAFVDGISPLEWRQGVKHDAASVMELIRDCDGYRNGLGHPVDVEPERIFPLLKGSDLFRGHCHTSRLGIIITQEKLGQDTAHLNETAPKLWKYLNTYRSLFMERKSSIYLNQPEFALFGIGGYSFLPYKVAISGFYKTPRFRAVPPHNERPVLLDDTCYFLSFDSAAAAALFVALLSDDLCLGLLNSLLFTDSKRPVTKKLLQRINMRAIFEHTDKAALFCRAELELKALTHNASDQSWHQIVEKYLPLELTNELIEQSSFHTVWR